MATAARWIPLVLLGVSAVLIGVAVASGTAQVALFLVFPVISGGSWTFLAGVLVLVAAFLSMPFAWASSSASVPTATPETASGGVLLLGPIPIFFGQLGAAERSRYLWWVALGCLFAVVALVVAVAFALGR